MKLILRQEGYPLGIEKMEKELDTLRKAIKKAKNKGGVRMALELADVDDALRNLQDEEACHKQL